MLFNNAAQTDFYRTNVQKCNSFLIDDPILTASTSRGSPKEYRVIELCSLRFITTATDDVLTKLHVVVFKISGIN